MPQGGGAGPREDAPTTTLSPTEEASTASSLGMSNPSVTHTFPKLPFPSTGARLVPFLRGGFRRMCSLLCSLSPWVLRSLWLHGLGAWWHLCPQHRDEPLGFELGISAGMSQNCLCSARAWLVSGKFGWGSSFCEGGLSMRLPNLERVPEFPEGQPAASTGKLLTKGHE